MLVLAAASESVVLHLSMEDGAATTARPAVQFKIEPFKHPVKMDPNYGGEQDSRVPLSSAPGCCLPDVPAACLLRPVGKCYSILCLLLAAG